MTVHERLAALADFPEKADVMVSLFRADGTILALPIDGVDEDAGVVPIEPSEAEGIIYSTGPLFGRGCSWLASMWRLAGEIGVNPQSWQSCGQLGMSSITSGMRTQRVQMTLWF